MPVVIDASEVQTRASFQGVAAWEDARKVLAEYLADPKQRENKAIAFTADDGFTKEKVGDKGQTRWMSGLQTLRNSAKALGFAISGVWNEEKQWLGVKYTGPYVEMTDEEKEARKAKREANKAAKLAAANGSGEVSDPAPEPVKGGRKR